MSIAFFRIGYLSVSPPPPRRDDVSITRFRRSHSTPVLALVLHLCNAHRAPSRSRNKTSPISFASLPPSSGVSSVARRRPQQFSGGMRIIKTPLLRVSPRSSSPPLPSRALPLRSPLRCAVHLRCSSAPRDPPTLSSDKSAHGLRLVSVFSPPAGLHSCPTLGTPLESCFKFGEPRLHRCAISRRFQRPTLRMSSPGVLKRLFRPGSRAGLNSSLPNREPAPQGGHFLQTIPLPRNHFGQMLDSRKDKLAFYTDSTLSLFSRTNSSCGERLQFPHGAKH